MATQLGVISPVQQPVLSLEFCQQFANKLFTIPWDRVVLPRYELGLDARLEETLCYLGG